jgi:hypothetical protein
MELLPGFIQGITRVLISYPFDTIKIHMQKNNKNMIETCKLLYQLDKKIFYRCSYISFICVPFDRSIQYFFMEKYNKQYNPFIISFSISLFSIIYILPLQYITNNALLHKNNFKIYNFVKNIEIKKIYNGLNIELSRNILATSIYSGSYFFLRNNYNKNNNIIISSCIGVFSNLLCWTIIYPLDTIKIYKQTTTLTYPNIISEFLKKKNYLHIYRGILPVYIRTVPSAFFGMFAYEYTKKLIT